jgi:hypothetical protein
MSLKQGDVERDCEDGTLIELAQNDVWWWALLSLLTTFSF